MSGIGIFPTHSKPYSERAFTGHAVKHEALAFEQLRSSLTDFR
jgi:hypothetical protein